jgi:hypothetical protein
VGLLTVTPARDQIYALTAISIIPGTAEQKPANYALIAHASPAQLQPSPASAPPAKLIIFQAEEIAFHARCPIARFA